MYAYVTTAECLDFVLFVKNKWNNRQFQAQTKMVILYLGCWGLRVLPLNISLILVCDWGRQMVCASNPALHQKSFQYQQDTMCFQMIQLLSWKDVPPTTTLAANKWPLNSIFHCHFCKMFRFSSLPFPKGSFMIWEAALSILLNGHTLYSASYIY